jgi:hypothetical protein
MQNAPVVKRQANLDGRDSRARINGAHRIPEPPRLSTFKRRGGGPESRAHLFNGYDRSAQINDAQGDSGPPPPAFLPLSGGGGSGIEDASLRRLRFERPDQRRTGNPDILCLSAFNQRGAPLLLCHPAICSPPDRAMRLAPFSPSSSSDICPSPLFWSMWSLSHLIIHSPPAMCPALFHVSLPLKCAHYISSPAPSAYCLPPCVFPCNLSHTHHFISHPSFGVTTPVMRPILRAGLHAYSSGRSANPGGSAKGLPRPKSVELAGPSSIPMKQLLR